MGNNGQNYQIGSSSSSSHDKNNNNNKGDKPKQPQRGLGVAQLERIRLESQLANLGVNPHYQYIPCAFPPFPPFPTPFQEQMRAQAAYHQASLLATPPPFGYGSTTTGSSALYDYNNRLTNYMRENGVQMGRTGNSSLPFGNEPHPSMNPRWMNPNNILLRPPENRLPSMFTKPLLNTIEENVKLEDFLRSNGSSGQNFAEPSNANEDLDLELKL